MTTLMKSKKANAPLSTNFGIFLRDFLGETPDGPHNSGRYSASPDIILNGTNALLDPSVYSKDYSKVSPNQLNSGGWNYVYIRGLNNADGITNARFWFFYTPSNLIIPPQSWKTTPIQLQDGRKQNYLNLDLSKSKKNDIIVTPPFLVNPEHLTEGSHYCTIALVETNVKLEDPDPQPPVPQSFKTYEDFVKFIHTSPFAAWRNTKDAPTGAYFSVIDHITTLDQEAAINVGIKCQNMPTDGEFSLSFQGADPSSSFNFPRHKIETPNYSAYNTVTLPPNQKFAITIEFWKGHTTPPAGACIHGDATVDSNIAMNALSTYFNSDNDRNNFLDNLPTIRMFKTGEIRSVYRIGRVSHQFTGK